MAPDRFAMGPGPESDALVLAIDFEPIDRSDWRLYHKTGDRSAYTVRQQRHAADDVLLTNDAGNITETAIANVAFLIDGTWVTPPVEDGLLPGIMRAELLRTGAIVEGSVSVPEALEADAVAVFNSVRGWLPATVIDPRQPEGVRT